MTALVAFTTVPDQDVADRLARALVEERLAACVSRIPGAVSTYRWQGDVEVAAEVLLLIKTTHERFEALRARLVELHPYDVPELIAMDIAHGHPAYLDWLADSVGRATA
jgi:periplasmic divalent cation tolerance protein